MSAFVLSLPRSGGVLSPYRYRQIISLSVGAPVVYVSATIASYGSWFVGFSPAIYTEPK
jgi:hypothetical protein